MCVSMRAVVVRRREQTTLTVPLARPLLETPLSPLRNATALHRINSSPYNTLHTLLTVVAQRLGNASKSSGAADDGRRPLALLLQLRARRCERAARRRGDRRRDRCRARAAAVRAEGPAVASQSHVRPHAQSHCREGSVLPPSEGREKKEVARDLSCSALLCRARACARVCCSWEKYTILNVGMKSYR